MSWSDSLSLDESHRWRLLVRLAVAMQMSHIKLRVSIIDDVAVLLLLHILLRRFKSSAISMGTSQTDLISHSTTHTIGH